MKSGFDRLENVKSVGSQVKFDLDGWRFDLKQPAFYKMFVIDGVKPFRVLGQMSETRAGGWNAEIRRVTQFMTCSQKETLKARGSDISANVELIPSPEETRNATIHWLRAGNHKERSPSCSLAVRFS